MFLFTSHNILTFKSTLSDTDTVYVHFTFCGYCLHNISFFHHFIFNLFLYNFFVSLNLKLFVLEYSSILFFKSGMTISAFLLDILIYSSLILLLMNLDLHMSHYFLKISHVFLVPLIFFAFFLDEVNIF